MPKVPLEMSLPTPGPVALLCLGLREIHSSDFSSQDMIEKLRGFARYGLTGHFHEILGERVFAVRCQGRSFTPTVLEVAAEEAQAILAAREQILQTNSLGQVPAALIKALSQGRTRSSLWVPGYQGGPRQVELATQLGGRAGKHRAQSLEAALPASLANPYSQQLFEVAHKHRLIVIAT